MNRLYKKLSILCGIALVLTLLSGCSAIHTSIAKKDLDVQTKMSDTVFLDPVGPSKKVIFLDIRNTSDKQDFNILAPIKQALEAKGYRISQNPDSSHYWLRANILNVTKTSPTAAEAAFRSNYGGALVGIATGVAIGGSASRWSGIGMGVGGLAGAAVGGLTSVVANALVKDVVYMVVTDIEIAAKAKKGVIINEDSRQNAKQGLGGSRIQSSSEISDRKKYRTRIVSTANKVNLDYSEAAPELKKGLVRSISGVL